MSAYLRNFTRHTLHDNSKKKLRSAVAPRREWFNIESFCLDCLVLLQRIFQLDVKFWPFHRMSAYSVTSVECSAVFVNAFEMAVLKRQSVNQLVNRSLKSD